MAYDYNNSAGNERFSPPNPLKIENYFVGAAGVVMFSAATSLLIVLRSSISSGDAENSIGGMLIGLFMFAISVYLLGKVASHLRFWFGRDRPLDISNSHGQKDSLAISQILHKRALEFPEPKGPMNGLLYSWMPDLIFSPLPIQLVAQQQFRNALTMCALLLSFLIALVGGSVGIGAEAWARVSDWIGLVYLLTAWYLLFGKFGTNTATKLESNGLIFLVVFSIIGPLLMSLVAFQLPALTWLSPYPHVFFIMLMALVVYSLFLIALLKQANKAPQTEVSVIQDRWDIQCHPDQIMLEFDRYMQQNWQDNIPNRIYYRSNPDINLTQMAGKFSANAIEETQPIMPIKQPMTFADALAYPKHKFLVALDVLGLLFLSIAAITLFIIGKEIGHDDNLGVLGLYAFSSLFLGSYAFKAAHHLWKRFNFQSRVIWIELDGNYTSAKMEHGNIMKDTIKTSSNVVQIESMTFRIRVAKFDTATFDVNGNRYVLSSHSDQEYAQHLLNTLREFAISQSIIVAPNSSKDIERHIALSKLNELSRNSELHSEELSEEQKIALVKNPSTEEQVIPDENQGNLASGDKGKCHECKADILPQASFCIECGAKLLK